MKKLLLVLFLSCVGVTASAMGHPHNLFSAHRKAQQYTKRTACQWSVNHFFKRTLTSFEQALVRT